MRNSKKLTFYDLGKLKPETYDQKIYPEDNKSLPFDD